MEEDVQQLELGSQFKIIFYISGPQPCQYNKALSEMV